MHTFLRPVTLLLEDFSRKDIRLATGPLQRKITRAAREKGKKNAPPSWSNGKAVFHSLFAEAFIARRRFICSRIIDRVGSGIVKNNKADVSFKSVVNRGVAS